MADLPLVKPKHAATCPCSECHPKPQPPPAQPAAQVIVTSPVTAERSPTITTPKPVFEPEPAEKKLKPIERIEARVRDTERRLDTLEQKPAGAPAPKPSKPGWTSPLNWAMFIIIIGVISYLVWIVYAESTGHHIILPFSFIPYPSA